MMKRSWFIFIVTWMICLWGCGIDISQVPIPPTTSLNIQTEQTIEKPIQEDSTASAIAENIPEIPFLMLDASFSSVGRNPSIAEIVDFENESFWENLNEGKYPHQFWLRIDEILCEVEWGDAYNPFDGNGGYAIIALDYEGMHWQLPDAVSLYPNSFQTYSTAQGHIIGFRAFNHKRFTGWVGRAVWYYIADNRIWEMQYTPMESGILYSFYVEEGCIKYYKENMAYAMVMSLIDLMEIYTYDGQFYGESGVLKVIGDVMQYDVVYSRSINEAYLLAESGYLKDLRLQYGYDSIGEVFRAIKESAAN